MSKLDLSEQHLFLKMSKVASAILSFEANFVLLVKLCLLYIRVSSTMKLVEEKQDAKESI